MRYGAAGLIWAAIAGCDGEPSPSAPAGELALIYSNNISGEIEPCG